MKAPALVASDRLVAALWRRGLASSAMDFARAAIARHDPHRAVLAEQLDALRDGARLTQHTEDHLELTFGHVSALVDRHRYHEARCLLRAVADDAGRVATPLAKLLDAALAPFPPEADPSYAALIQLIRVGQAPAALRALEEVMTQLSDTPRWLLERQRSLAALASGEWRDVLEPVGAVTRDTVLERLRHRDLPGALEAAQQAGAHELAGRLRRLLAATNEITDAPEEMPEEQRTLPIEGLGMAIFQVRMGALASADGSLRKLLRRDDDERAREILADVLAVRRALGEEVHPIPARAAKVHWLDKKRPAQSEGWSGSEEGRYQSYADAEPEDSTGVLNAAHEAELLLKLGKTDQALDLYRLLAIRHPKSAAYRVRIREIEALIAQNLAPVAVEVTAKHDLTALIEKSLPTGARLKIDARPTARSVPRYEDEDDDGPTLVEDLE